jgi:phage terminase large subunit-like protein
MTSSQQKAAADIRASLRALRRRTSTEAADDDRVAFARALGLELDPWQADFVTSDGRRDLLNCSRQAGKSTAAAVLALHEALHSPDSVTVLVSPSQRQSSELFRKVVELRERLPYRPELLEDNRLSMHVRGGGRVLSLPGSEQTIRGISAVSLLIEDEAARVDDDLYRSVRPMLAVRNGRLVLMSTPFGKRGHFYQEWSDGGDGWSRVRVPATEVPRISAGFLEEERSALGDWWYRQEYLCDFVEAEDAFFRDDDVLGAITAEVKPLLFRIGAPA